MPRSIVISLAILALCALAPALPASAAPADITRIPDGELRFCPEGYACTARAVGDFNGDGMADMLFEYAPMDGSRRFDGFNAGVRSRRFELHLSPYRATGTAESGAAERVAEGRVSIALRSAQVIDPVTVSDIDDDGMDDLVFYRTPDTSIVVLRGKTRWPATVSLNNMVTSGDVRIDLASFAQTERGVTPSVMLAAHFADVNGDGRRDLVVGRESQDGSRFDGDAADTARLSDVGVMFGTGAWPAHVMFEPATRVVGLRGCAQGLAGVAEVTGDGVGDLVLRRCLVKGQPAQLRVLPGRAQWPATLSPENVPDIPPPEPEPPSPEPPVRGGYLPSTPPLAIKMPETVTLQDVNGDGVGDLGLEFASKIHLWYGGRDVVDRARMNRSGGVFLRTGFGALPLTRTWRPLDFNTDGRADLVLSRPIDAALLACPDGSCDAGGGASPATGQPVYVYAGGQTRRRVLDVGMDAPDALWNSPGAVIWGIGDFNGDRVPDLLLGSPPGAFDSIYTLVFGPLAAR